MKVKRLGGSVHNRPNHTNGQPEPVATALMFPSQSQPANPANLHVTQKVVLYNQSDLDEVLALIKYQDTSAK